jgi:cytochrome c biogenesis factor
MTMPEVTPDGATVRGLINPLVLLVWIGGGIMGLGVVLNIIRPRRREAHVLGPVPVSPGSPESPEMVLDIPPHRSKEA